MRNSFSTKAEWKPWVVGYVVVRGWEVSGSM